MGTIYKATLESILVGLVVSIFMAYMALEHNPQNEFYDTMNGGVVVENLLLVMASWLLTVAVCFGAVRILLTYLFRKSLK